jgi:hypothetical protein
MLHAEPARAPAWAVAARLLLAAIFLATATGKLLDIGGFAGVLLEYRLLPAPLLSPVALTVSVFELAVAAGLLWWPTLRVAAMAAMLLALLNAVALVLTLARGIALENCGCFGVYLARPLRPWTPLEDLVLAGVAALVLLGYPARRQRVVPA